MQEIRDQLGKIIAVITTDSQGIQTIKTQLGEILGTYNPKTNETRTFLGQIVGYGNLLTTLIR